MFRIIRKFSSQIPARTTSYGQVTPTIIDELRAAVSAPVLTAPDDVEKYCEDWMRKYKARSQCVVVRPKTTEEVSAVLRVCTRHRLAVVPQGGNTGLVGGSVPVYDEIVLSTERMNQVEQFDERSGVAVVQAGVVLQTLDEYVRERGFVVPLDLGAKGSCNIGGNVSTNAGGIRLLRYGSLRGSVLGIEAVLANGDVIDSLKTLRKDNTGYDLKQLFIGSEGTLGVVTRVALLCAPLSASTNVVLLSARSFEDVVEILRVARAQLAEILSAYEFFDDAAFRLYMKHGVDASNPLGAEDDPFYVLIETRGSVQRHDKEKLDSFLESVMSTELASNGAVADSETQQAQVWAIREGITESLLKEGAVYKYDVSLPLDQYYELVEAMRARFDEFGMSDDVIVVGYGHVGDGNLHLNITAPSYDAKYENVIEPFVYEFVAEHNGSISAEHGLGLMKANMIHYSKSDECVRRMHALKSTFDPLHLLNPYKVLPNAD